MLLFFYYVTRMNGPRQPTNSAEGNKLSMLAHASFGCSGGTASTTTARAARDAIKTVPWLRPDVLWISVIDLRPKGKVCGTFPHWRPARSTETRGPCRYNPRQPTPGSRPTPRHEPSTTAAGPSLRKANQPMCQQPSTQAKGAWDESSGDMTCAGGCNFVLVYCTWRLA